MSAQRDDTLDRAIGRFLKDQAETGARRALSAEAVATMLVTRQGGRALARPRLVLALTLLLLGAFIVGLIGAMQHARGATGPIPGNLAWSPDGSMLAFSTLDLAKGPGGASGTVDRAIEIWVVNADGSGLRRIARDLDALTGFRTGASITWSPDGRFVAYDLPPRRTESWFAVQAVDAATRAEFAGWPVAWSPVEDRLLVQIESSSSADLALVAAAAGGPQPITSSGDAWGASWSPDGSLILYVSGLVQGGQALGSELQVVSSEGLRTHGLGVCCDLGWAPDASVIYYSRDLHEIRAIAPDGTGDRLVDRVFEWTGWSWQPDGSRYVTASGHGLEVRSPGGKLARLTHDENDADPSWSPNGAWIAFRGDRDAGAGGFVVPASGGTPTFVAPDALTTSQLAWRPGTDELAFVRGHDIEAVSAAGSDRVVIVESRMLGGRPDDLPAPGVPRIVIGPQGPDHDVYRVPAPADFELLLENTTDDTWRIDLDGFGIFPENCRAAAQGDLELVAYHGPSDAAEMTLATPPDFCGVAPHDLVRVVRPQQVAGAELVAVTNISTGVRYPVILEFGP